MEDILEMRPVLKYYELNRALRERYQDYEDEDLIDKIFDEQFVTECCLPFYVKKIYEASKDPIKKFWYSEKEIKVATFIHELYPQFDEVLIEITLGWEGA